MRNKIYENLLVTSFGLSIKPSSVLLNAKNHTKKTYFWLRVGLRSHALTVHVIKLVKMHKRCVKV
jgi:hypothetical protein